MSSESDKDGAAVTGKRQYRGIEDLYAVEEQMRSQEGAASSDTASGAVPPLSEDLTARDESLDQLPPRSSLPDVAARPERTARPRGGGGSLRVVPKPARRSKTRLKEPPSLPSDPEFQNFVKRWRPLLKPGQLSMCGALYRMTHALGRTDCETSFSVLMRESGLSRRQSFEVIAQLETVGFVWRLTTPKHSTRKGTGSRFRFFLDPKPNPTPLGEPTNLNDDNN